MIASNPTIVNSRVFASINTIVINNHIILYTSRGVKSLYYNCRKKYSEQQ